MSFDFSFTRPSSPNRPVAHHNLVSPNMRRYWNLAGWHDYPVLLCCSHVRLSDLT
jgi:hypothetical protein